MIKTSCMIGLVMVVMCLVPLSMAQAYELIDFETGFVDQQMITAPIVTATNEVTFLVQDPNTGAISNPYIAQVGAPPETAFVDDDTPADTSISGDFFLTDEFNGPVAKLDYIIKFANPVADLSLNLYDYRVDGGPQLGDTATLLGYADLGMTQLVGTDVFTIPQPNPVDGNIETLSLFAPSAPILAAKIVFNRGDVGTGIDNIQFTTVPEPGTMLLLGLGLIGLAGLRRKLKK